MYEHFDFLTSQLAFVTIFLLFLNSSHPSEGGVEVHVVLISHAREKEIGTGERISNGLEIS